MHFGFCLPNNQGVDDPGELVALAREAESQGYDSVWVSEHLFHAGHVAARLGDRPYHEPLSLLAAVATQTRRVALGTSVLVLPWHHPVRLAKQVATLDSLSRGRVLLGVGVGSTPDEFAALGVSYAARGRITDEVLCALDALFEQELPAFKGEHYAFEGLRFEPKPVQRPRPPVLVGGNSRAALRRVVRHGDGWHPLGLSPEALAGRLVTLRAGLEAAGRDPRLPVAVRVVLELRDTPFARPPAQRRTARGTPDEVASMLRAYADAGVTHLLVDPNTPELTRVRESLQRFGAEVRPALG